MSRDPSHPSTPTWKSGSNRWRAAYLSAIINASVFLLLSLAANVVSGLPLQADLAIALLFAAGSLYVGLRLARTAGSVSPTTFFVIGSGLVFGFGTAYSTYVDSETFFLIFPPYEQEQNLRVINLINATAVFCVIATSWLMCGRMRPQEFHLAKAVEAFHRPFALIWLPLVVLSFLVLALQYWYFPAPGGLLARNFVSKAQLSIPFLIFASFAYWPQMTPTQRVVIVVLLLVDVTHGALALNKTDAVMPLAAAIVGMWFRPSLRRVALVAGSTVAIVYVLLFSPYVGYWRTAVSPTSTGIWERIDEIRRVDAPAHGELRTAGDIFARFAHAPVQSYIVSDYRDGGRGETLADAWVAVVPRALWPEKPIVTGFGPEFYARMMQRDATSALAPTFSAEAYWNWGFFGVVLVAAVIGLQVGWLSGKWLKAVSGDRRNLGIVVFSIPVSQMYFWVEAWIVPTYIGGFVSVVILVKFIDALAPIVLRRVDRGNRKRALTRRPVRQGPST